MPRADIFASAKCCGSKIFMYLTNMCVIHVTVLVIVCIVFLLIAKRPQNNKIYAHKFIFYFHFFKFLSLSRKMIPKVYIEPPERSSSLMVGLDRMTLPELGPCGGFTQMYACMCDLHGLAYQAEVAWVRYAEYSESLSRIITRIRTGVIYRILS